MTACVRGAIFAGRPVFFLLFRFVGDKEDDAVVDDERLFLVFLLLIDGWQEVTAYTVPGSPLGLGAWCGRPGRCLQIFF